MRRYGAQHRGSLTQRAVFLVLNQAMGIAGLVLLGYSVYAYYGLRQYYLSFRGSPCAGAQSFRELLGDVVSYHDDDDTASMRDGAYTSLFTVTFAAAGAWTFLTALFSLLPCHRDCFQKTHRLMLWIALVADILGWMSYSYLGWGWDLPVEDEGHCTDFWKYPLTRWRTSLCIWFVVVFLQFAAIVPYSEVQVQEEIPRPSRRRRSGEEPADTVRQPLLSFWTFGHDNGAVMDTDVLKEKKKSVDTGGHLGGDREAVSDFFGRCVLSAGTAPLQPHVGAQGQKDCVV